MRDQSRPERPDVAAKAVTAIALGFLAFVAVALIALLAYYRLTAGSPSLPEPSRFAEPRLQADPRADRLRLEAAQRERLAGYAWVDRDRGVARVPITDAMAMVAARGQAAFDPVEGAAGTDASKSAKGSGP
ncbi:hypothetical protein SLNSH_04160 [Alsobacter soli]|uniref:Uncharacterized protein n=1 Tax=Alsobacter soli TaxID=2109933 RepID=A0A2T1HY22_9HYPH|nr:hypothetical protein [Alsobacter soli]PSC06478.1 hypothetical protein SLNSH_04160 [Alsobacter soli]